MDYYNNQLSRIQVGKTIYPPLLKVYANGNGEDTNHMSLNDESAGAIMLWLANNFNISSETKNELISFYMSDKDF